MRKFLVAAVFLAALSFDLRPAPAGEAPWCAVVNIGWGEPYWDCSYASVEACRPNVIAGNRGFCNLNPRFSGWNERAEVPRRHGKRHKRAY